MTVNPLYAVLAPPEEAQFRALTGVGDVPLDVDVDGWSKLAILSADRVFLFPRRGRDAALRHGMRVCRALSSLGVSAVPSVLGEWGPKALPRSGPFVAFERRRGRAWTGLEATADVTDFETMLVSLGEAIATWHAVPLTTLSPGLIRPPNFSPKPTLDRLLAYLPVEEALAEAVELLTPTVEWLSAWEDALVSIGSLDPVLIHGDVCENQLLVDENLCVTTVLDWDTAGVSHPLHDFDFGEWGFTIFRLEHDFARLRQAMWRAYQASRSIEVPRWEEVHLVFTLADLISLSAERGKVPSIIGEPHASNSSRLPLKMLPSGRCAPADWE